MTKRWMSRSFLLAAVAMTSTVCTTLPETPRAGADAGDSAVASTDGVPVPSADGMPGLLDVKPASGDGAAIEAVGRNDVPDALGGAAADIALPTVDAASAEARDVFERVFDSGTQEDAPLSMDQDGAALDLAGVDNQGALAGALDATAVDSSAVIPCGPRDCRSSADHNCNGVADNAEPECACPIANQSATCQAAQNGICSVGTKLCTFSVDNTTSAWSACLPGSPRSRDCTSTADNNCDGKPDNTETACGCPSAATKSCSTGLLGICATGTATCTVSADKTSSQWGACVPPTPRTRDCTSTNDNNCDGTPDKNEAPCADCSQTAPRVCNTHPGYDGIGTCTAGAQAVVMAADKSECHWGECTGDQEPSKYELCGVDAPDINCSGTRGDGTCAVMLKIFSQTNWVTCSCSTSGSYSTYSATTSSSGSGLSQFKVFTGNRPANTAAVCNEGGSVTIRGDCLGGSTPVGYVSTVQGKNYLPLTYTSSTMPCGGNSTYSAPLGPGKTSTTLNYYVVP